MLERKWKPIKGYEGHYEISNYGEVRSLIFRNNKVEKQKIHYLTPTDNGYGYKIVGLKNGKKRKNHYIHRLVAEAFIENPLNLPVVNHLDHDRSNNRADNLEWLTQKENVNYSLELMKKPHCSKTNTGEKYIRLRDNSYIFSYEKMKIYKSFKTLDEAVNYRNEVMNGAK